VEAGSRQLIYLEHRYSSCAILFWQSESILEVVRKKFGGVKTVAGLSFVGFCAASVIADRVNLNPMASQVAGFIGAFLGALVGRRQSQGQSSKSQVGLASNSENPKD
jgi:hypothetical protein